MALELVEGEVTDDGSPVPLANRRADRSDECERHVVNPVPTPDERKGNHPEVLRDHRRAGRIQRRSEQYLVILDLDGWHLVDLPAFTKTGQPDLRPAIPPPF